MKTYLSLRQIHELTGANLWTLRQQLKRDLEKPLEKRTWKDARKYRNSWEINAKYFKNKR